MLDPAGKVALLREYRERYELRVVIETGLYQGSGSGWQAGAERCIVIDSDNTNCDTFRNAHPDAEVWCGDSGTLMPHVLKGVEEPALFWLDAHPVTEDSAEQTPLLAELRAITEWGHATQSVVLIDDVRMMGREGWPSLSDVVHLNTGEYEAHWLWENKDDILRLTP